MNHPSPDAFLHTHDGLQLHLHAWPAAAPARGTAVLVHGLGEHIGRYAQVVASLNAWGWHVQGFDLRGHGRSQGPRGGVAHADDLLRDLSSVIDHARSCSDGPLLLVGHSLGGLIASRFVAGGLAAVEPGWHRSVDALVLSSPAFDPGATVVQKILIAVGSRLVPNLALNNGLKLPDISRDPQVVAAYGADPLVHDRITPKLARLVVDMGRWVRAHAAQWTLPTLLMYAGSDRCVAPAGSKAFAAVAPRSVVTVREFGPLFHELFNEPERAEVMALMRDWLEARWPSVPLAR